VKISADLPQGVTALLFESARRRRALEARMVAALEAEGFAEVVLPIVDYLEPYEALLTPASRGELYRFVDRDGELLALRADFTPLLARLLAPSLAPDAAGRRALPLPQRLFYRGDVVRYEEERPGRQREFYQVGAELLGVAGEEAEREMLGCFLTLLEAAAVECGEGRSGAPGGGTAPSLRVVLGLAGALDAALAEAAADGADPAALAEAVARRERGPVRRRGGVLAAVVEHGRPEDPAALGRDAGRRLERLLALRDEMAARFPAVELVIDLAEFAHQVLDPALAAAAAERSYYDGLVFRAYAGDLALPAGSGGRYDRLFSRLGADVAAVGFSFGLERLLADAPRGRRRPTAAAAGAEPAAAGRGGGR
jgi:ATP phosphoribosyltransferase regulatory subunit